VRPQSSRPLRLVGYQMEFNHVVVFRHYYTVGSSSGTTATVDALTLAVLNKFSTVFSITPQAEMTGPLEVDQWMEFFLVAGTELVYRTVYHLPVKELIVVQ